jgi:hypothetical protein
LEAQPAFVEYFVSLMRVRSSIAAKYTPGLRAISYHACLPIRGVSVRSHSGTCAGCIVSRFSRHYLTRRPSLERYDNCYGQRDPRRVANRSKKDAIQHTRWLPMNATLGPKASFGYVEAWTFAAYMGTWGKMSQWCTRLLGIC